MSAQITEIAISRGHAYPGDRFFKVAQLSSGACIWYRRGEGEPIVEVRIVHGEDEAEPGFVKIPENLNQTNQKPVYLHCRQGKPTAAHDAIIDMKVVTTAEPTVGPGFVRISDAINPDTTKDPIEYLCFKSRISHEKSSRPEVCVGDMFDCLDTANSWLAAQCVDIKEETDEIYVRYIGWAERWNEWIKKNSPRIAPIGTHSQGKTKEEIRVPFNIDQELLKYELVVDHFHTLLEKALEGKEALTEEESQFLISKDNYDFVFHSLNCIVEDPRLFTYVQGYLQGNLRLLVHSLKKDKEIPTHFIFNLHRIFGGDRNCQRLYTKYTLQPSEKTEGPFAGMHKSGTEKLPPSVLLVENVNYFGQLGGFEIIADRLRAKGDNADAFPVTSMLMRILSIVRPRLSSEFAAKYFQAIDIPNLVRSRILNITDDELRQLEKNALEKLLHDACGLLVEADPAEFYEKATLDISLRLLNSKVLAQSLNGMNALENNITKVRNKQRAQYQAHSSADARNVAHFITPEYLLKWLEDNQVVGIILDKERHEQIIKRSPVVLKFLAQMKRLDNTHLDLLWNSAIGKHEALVRIVYDTIAELAQELTEEQLDVLYKRMCSTPASEMQDFHLDFIKKFSISAMKATKDENKAYGLDIFWNMLLEEEKLPAPVIESTLNTLKQLLDQPSYRNHRVAYLLKCLASLQTGRAVVVSLRLAQQILSAMNEPNSDEDPMAVLEKKHSIVSTVVTELQTYNQKAREALSKKKTEAKDVTKTNTKKTGKQGKDPITVGCHPHSVELTTRLEFLSFFLANSDVALTKENIEALWGVFCTNAVLPADSSVLFSWLTKSITTAHGRHTRRCVLGVELPKHIFGDYLCKSLDFAKLDAKGYECFEAYFAFVNWQEKALLNQISKHVHVMNYKLIGLESLWLVAGLAEDAEVREAAKRFLTSLHIRLDYRFSSEDKKTIFKTFIQKCLNLLSAAFREVQGQADVEHHTKSIDSLVELITTFLARLESGEMIKKPSFRVGDHVLASWKGGSTLYDATIQAVNPDGTYQAKYADGDFDPECPEKNIRSRDPEKKKAEKSLESDDADVPRYLLSNEPAYFNLLFDLLGIGGELGRKVWKLVVRLPTNKALADKINAVGLTDAEVDWNQIFPSNSIIKVLYTLQIVELNARSQEGSDNTYTARWCEVFMKKGGVAHLYKVFTQLSTEDLLANLIPQQCLRLLLRMLVLFFSGHSGTDSRAALNGVDLNALGQRLLKVLVETVALKAHDAPKGKSGSKSHTTDESVVHGDIIKESFSLLRICVVAHPSVLDAICQYNGWKAYCIAGLLMNSNALVRQANILGIYDFCKNFDGQGGVSPRSVFLPVLLNCLGDIDTNSTSSFCIEYFDLVAKLLEGAKSGEDAGINAAEVGQQLTSKIKEHPVLEARAEDTDNVLCGLLSLVRQLVSQDNKLKQMIGTECGLIEEVMHCLFDLPQGSVKHTTSAGPPKCKSPKSRKLAFDLLAELSRGCASNRERLLDLLVPNHQTARSGRMDEWSFEAKTEEKSRTGYVGLKNLGCICYMNSTMQQLFMLPKLRAGLLAVEDKDEDKSESLIYQLQYLFAFLQESEKMYANPKGFCQAFKDENGKPTNTSIQEDCGQFLTKLIDRINDKVKNTPYKNVFRDVLGGVFSHELIGRGNCKHYREREEEFFSVSVEIKNMKNIEESLKLFVQGELLEGNNAYRCDKCNTKVDTLKRTCFKKLPSSMCFVLKRFALDYTTLETTKLNDRLEFPMRLNMKAYTKEFLGLPSDGKEENAEPIENADDGKSEAPVIRPDEYYEYVLRGMVIHVGSATHGHYYSFIQERLMSEGEDGDCGGRWFEFNDSVVSDFDSKTIADKCYGGTEERSADSRYMGYGPSLNSTGDKAVLYEKSASAYLLIYDRIVKKKVEVKPVMEKLSFEGAAQAVRFTERMKKKLRHAQSARAMVPSKLLHNIWQENLAYWKDKAVFDTAYFDFVWNVISNVPVATKSDDDVTASPAAVEVASKFVFNTLSRAFHKDSLPQWVGQLKSLYSNNVPACRAFLKVLVSNDNRWLFDFLLRCTDADSRGAFTEVLLHVLSVVAPHEEEALTVAIHEESNKDSLLHHFGSVLIGLLRECPPYWKTFTQYFHVLAHFSQLNTACLYFLLHNNMLAKMVDFWLGDRSPHPEVNNMPVDAAGRRVVMGDQYTSADFTYLTPLLRNLMCGTAPYNSEIRPITAVDGMTLYPLTDVTRDMLFNSDIFFSFIMHDAKTKKRAQFAGDMVVHHSWENEQVSNWVLKNIQKYVSKYDGDHLRPFFRILTRLLELEDSFQKTRVSAFLQWFIRNMLEQHRFWRYTDVCLEHLIRMSKKIPTVKAQLQECSADWEWMIKWVHMFPKPPNGTEENIEMYKHRDTGYRASFTAQTFSLPAKEKGRMLTAIRESKDMDAAIVSDSDEDFSDRFFEVDQRVDCLDSAKKWLKSKIVAVHGDKVKVSYEGWDSKWDEWLDRWDPRIRELGRFSNSIKPDLERVPKNDGGEPGRGGESA